MLIGTALAIVLAAAPEAPETGLALELKGPATAKKGEPVKLTVTLHNRGKQELTLVQPGDGSECGWRSPVVTWLVDGPKPRVGFGRCGNVNPLRASEVFVLKPGEKVELGAWVGGPNLTMPGKYSVKLRYVNDPAMKWKGLPLGNHDAAAMERVRRSSAVSVDSNPLEIVISE